MSRPKGNKRSTARTVAQVAAVLMIVCGLATVGGVAWMTDRAVNVPASPKAPDNKVDAGTADPYGFETVDWDAWEEINPDIVAWIQVPGTSVSYPVAAATADDPEFYLHHDAYGDWNFAGTPFLDSECEGDFDAGCAPILGHHLNNGTLFSELAEMSDKEWAAEHSVVLLQTRNWKRVYDVMYADVVNAAKGGKVVKFDGPTQFAEWFEIERAGADMVLDEVTVPPRAMQLVTCSYSTYRNERTVTTCAARLELPADWTGYAQD